MKSIALFLLFAFCPCCFGQTDTNVLAVGDWSEPVSDRLGFTLRGRLLIYDAEGRNLYGIWPHAKVYLELQQLCQGLRSKPVEVYLENQLDFDMRDAFDNPIPSRPTLNVGQLLNPYWVTLACDSTVRLRADGFSGSESKPDGLRILAWLIPPTATNDFFLSGTFTPPTNNPSSLGYHVWQGTLKLPRAKIPVKKP